MSVECQNHRRSSLTAWLCGSLLSCLLLGYTSVAYGVGLGEISHSSKLGRPLQAEIELVSPEEPYEPEEVRVRQIVGEEATDLGIELVDSHLRYNLEPRREGKRFYIVVKSTLPINEPYINMLVELRWPTGQVYREYTLFLDPPMIAEPAKAGPQSIHSSSMAVDDLADSSARPVRQPAPRRQIPPHTQAAPVLPTFSTSGGDYVVRPGDTLSKIAQRWRQGNNESLGITTQWLHEHNPRAFIRGDINRLMAGAKLKLPHDIDLPLQVSGRFVTERESEPVAAKPRMAADTKPRSSDEADGVLTLTREQLVAAGETAAKPRVDEQDEEKLRNYIAANKEQTDKLQRENKQLRERLERMEDSNYMGSLEELVGLQDRQIADMREQMGLLRSEALTDNAVAGLESGSTGTSVPSSDGSRTLEGGTLQQLPTQSDGERRDKVLALSGVNPADVAADKTAPEETTAAQQAGMDPWWIFSALVFLVLLMLGFLIWRTYRHPELAPAGADSAPGTAFVEDEDAILEELDNLADTYKEEQEQNFQELFDIENEEEDTPAGSPGDGVVTDRFLELPRKPRRPEEEVKRDIEKKTAEYIPPEVDPNVDLPHQEDNIDEVISEALGYAASGRYDLAEALLQAEQVQAGNDPRLADALHYVDRAKIRNTGGG